MPIKVLVVDDSAFFRRRVSDLINNDSRFTVIDTAANGKEAVEKVKAIMPDVITMDIEMPVMDGITAVKEIMGSNPKPILMFSSLTTEGAEATLKSLEAGAVDYLPKRFEDIAKNTEEARKILLDRLFTVSKSHVRKIISRDVERPAAPVRKPLFKQMQRKQKTNIDIVVIGTSTGGPVALLEVLKPLPENFPLPIVVVQHMPATFTGMYAKRLEGACQLSAKEAEDGDVLMPGMIYVAPGGKQLQIDKKAGKPVVGIVEMANLHYKPCVDYTLESLMLGYGPRTLIIILTGMGADGCEGAKKMKARGAQVWAQDEASCTVYGMPAAIVNGGLADKVLALDKISKALDDEV